MIQIMLIYDCGIFSIHKKILMAHLSKVSPVSFPIIASFCPPSRVWKLPSHTCSSLRWQSRECCHCHGYPGSLNNVMIPAITSPGHRDCVTRVSACDFQEAPLSWAEPEQVGVNISIKHQSRVLGQKLLGGSDSYGCHGASRGIVTSLCDIMWHQTWNETMFCKIFSKMEKLGNCSILAARSAGAVTSVTQARVESGPGPSRVSGSRICRWGLWTKVSWMLWVKLILSNLGSLCRQPGAGLHRFHPQHPVSLHGSHSSTPSSTRVRTRIRNGRNVEFIEGGRIYS